MHPLNPVSSQESQESDCGQLIRTLALVTANSWRTSNDLRQSCLDTQQGMNQMVPFLQLNQSRLDAVKQKQSIVEKMHDELKGILEQGIDSMQVRLERVQNIHIAHQIKNNQVNQVPPASPRTALTYVNRVPPASPRTPLTYVNQVPPASPRTPLIYPLVQPQTPTSPLLSPISPPNHDELLSPSESALSVPQSPREYSESELNLDFLHDDLWKHEDVLFDMNSSMLPLDDDDFLLDDHEVHGGGIKRKLSELDANQVIE
jgi:hypothetical protein